jgi:RES domain-containing protein
MMPLPPPLGSGEFIFWRLDKKIHAATWNTGEGSFRAGGRWNSRGIRTVYAALDPATAILEVAVHKGFRALDIDPHVLTSARILDLTNVHIVRAADVPNANWLKPGTPSAGQQAFGDGLVNAYSFILIPSVVSTHSWNILFVNTGAGLYDNVSQEDFALDGRLHPAVP